MTIHPMKSVADAGAAVENAAGAVLDSGAEVANYAGRHARTAGADLEDFVRRNPLASVGGALALGLLAGVLARPRIFG